MCGTMSGTWNTKINQYEEGVNQGRWVTWQRNVLGEFLTGGRRSAEVFSRRWCFWKEELELEAEGRTDQFQAEGVLLAQTSII